MQKQSFWLIIILANIALAFITVSDPLRAINSDGVLYLQTAEAYLQGGWHAAMRLYPWPFYSVLIAWVSQGCHCSLELAAYLMNTLFQILLCLGFFNLACQIVTHSSVRSSLRLRARHCERSEAKRGRYGNPGNKSNISGLLRILCHALRARNDRMLATTASRGDESLFMLFTTLTILLYPAFNHHRDLIIRDFGYWAFSLWGWFYLIRLNKDQRCLDGIGFGVSMLFASLFRLEGIVMLLCAPFAVFGRWQMPILKRINIFLHAYATAFILLMSSVIYFWIYADTPDNFGRLLDIKTQIYSGVSLITQGLLQAKHHIASDVLTPVSMDSATPLLVGGLIAVYIKMLITTLTLFYSILLGVSIWKKQFSPTSSATFVIGVAIFLNILITLVFLAQSLFLTERYLFALCFLLLLWIPFTLLWIYQQQKPWIFSGTLMVMVLIAMISLHNFGPSKIYLKQAGNWVHENLPKQGWIYTNSPQLGFYMQRPFVTWQNNASTTDIKSVVQNVKQKGYAYLVFQVKSKDVLFKNQLSQLLAKPVKVFTNEEGDAVWVFCLLLN